MAVVDPEPNGIEVCPVCGDLIPAVLLTAHMKNCSADHADPTGVSDPEIIEDLPAQEPAGFETSVDVPAPANPLDLLEEGAAKYFSEEPPVYETDAPVEDDELKQKVNDQFFDIIGDLDFDARAITEVNVALLDNQELMTRFSRVRNELMERKEMMNPKTETGRDLHSERAAYIIELRRRGLM